MSPSPLTAPRPRSPRAPLTKKILTADHPTWCPGCGDFAVLASFYRVLESSSTRRRTSSPWRASAARRASRISSTPTASTTSTGAPSLRRGREPRPRRPARVRVRGRRRRVLDRRQPPGPHGRKNVRLTYVIMDNFVYGLTKKQTSPTSPIGFKSKTDPTGAIDQPINPDAHARQQRRHLRRPQPRDPGEPHDRDDGARRAPRRLLGRRDPLRVRRVLRGRLRRGSPARAASSG
jgi:2-oxoglutarate/2-oxoacid ferredoxin oxidoreductase subunit beta